MVIDLSKMPQSVECPNCGHEFQETVGRLQSDEGVVCPACSVGGPFDFTIDEIEAHKFGVGQVIEEFKEAVAHKKRAGIGKRRARPLGGIARRGIEGEPDDGSASG